MRSRKTNKFVAKKNTTLAHRRQSDKEQENVKVKLKDFSHLDSAELALSVVTVEYQTENERSNTLTTRSGLLLSVMVLAATFILQNIRFDLLERTSNTLMGSCRYCAFFLTTILCLTSVIASIIILIISVITKPYERIECTCFDSDKTLSFKRDKVAASVIKAYVDVICKNSKRNNTKAKLYNLGTLIGISGLILAVIQRILQEI